MPNWCQNTLVVEGKQEDIKEFRDFIKGETIEGKERIFDFGKVISTEGEEAKWRKEWDKLSAKEQKERWHDDFGTYWFNVGKGYGWCVENWGTKWNACDTDISIDEPEKFAIFFATAWSPPEPIIKELAMQFNKLDFTFEYEEWGMAFAGVYETKKGRVVNEGSWDIDIGECPNCEYTNVKPTEQEKYVCGDCQHEYTNDEVVEQ